MPKKIESLEQVEPVSYEGKYICLNGMNYADVRRERGDIVDDIPADSLEWLLEWGHVEPYTGQVLGDPPAIPHVERRVRKTDHIVDANEMVELAEAGYPIIEPVVVVLEQEESDVREAVIAEIDEQQAGNEAAEGE
jgi:hypothetical protein